MVAVSAPSSRGAAADAADRVGPRRTAERGARSFDGGSIWQARGVPAVGSTPGRDVTVVAHSRRSAWWRVAGALVVLLAAACSSSGDDGATSTSSALTTAPATSRPPATQRIAPIPTCDTWVAVSGRLYALLAAPPPSAADLPAAQAEVSRLLGSIKGDLPQFRAELDRMEVEARNRLAGAPVDTAVTADVAALDRWYEAACR